MAIEICCRVQLDENFACFATCVYTIDVEHEEHILVYIVREPVPKKSLCCVPILHQKCRRGREKSLDKSSNKNMRHPTLGLRIPTNTFFRIATAKCFPYFHSILSLKHINLLFGGLT